MFKTILLCLCIVKPSFLLQPVERLMKIRPPSLYFEHHCHFCEGPQLWAGQANQIRQLKMGKRRELEFIRQTHGLHYRSLLDLPAEISIVSQNPTDSMFSSSGALAFWSARWHRFFCFSIHLNVLFLITSDCFVLLCPSIAALFPHIILVFNKAHPIIYNECLLSIVPSQNIPKCS